MVTARDVAEKLGVSISTVGRSMLDDPRISVETKQRVRQMADKLGYVGNAPARFMRSGTSNLVGLLIPDVMNDFYSAIAQALSACLDRDGYRVVLALTGDDRDNEERQIKELVGSRVAGIILVPTAAPRRTGLTLLRSVPHVQLLRRTESIGGAWFGIDDERCLFDAATHLAELGHTRIAYIGGSEQYSTGALRVEGFRRALKTHGIKPALIELGSPTQAFGKAAMEKLLDAKVAPTAVVSGSFHSTMGMLETLQKRKVSVPTQLSVVGFGDPPWTAWWGPGLTTVRPSVHELAMMCGLWFLHYLRTKNADAEESRSDSNATSKLVIRGSTRRLNSAKGG